MEHAKDGCCRVHFIQFDRIAYGISHVINHDLELRFFIHYCISKGIDVLKFNIQFKIYVDSVPPSYSSVAPSSSSSSCVSNNDVAIIEDLTDDSSLVKRVPKNGYKLDVGKSDKKRYAVECMNKKSQNYSWRFHASVVAKTKGVFQCKKFREEHSCDLASSDPAKVRMTKSFLKDILMDEFQVSKKKKTASDVQDLLHLEYEIYPVAFGIVPCENCESWEWFLTNLKGIIREDHPLTIISYRGAGLLKHVPVIFPKAYHSYCLYHMKGNIPVPKGKSRQTAVKLFEECYTVLTKEKYYAAAKSMSNLKLDSVIGWMVKIPFQNWEAHAFQGERFGDNTLNIAKSFNNVIKHDKRLPALELIDCIRAKVMDQNYKRLVESSKWTSKLTPSMQARLNKRIGPDEPYKYIITYYTTEFYRGLYARPIYPIPDSEKPPKINEEGYVFPPNGGRA
ncbi:uncharacterized protein LOC113278776 [Papaver somniferum]|uniref:uncharacterized protein LOC113278776 n=1 Tax=Papaver somniferum TaxID=3469 RepID=UPI000E6F8A92|nr:uncharacterized protein LOC113278776 [Papaver somniferum]